MEKSPYLPSNPTRTELPDRPAQKLPRKYKIILWLLTCLIIILVIISSYFIYQYLTSQKQLHSVSTAPITSVPEKQKTQKEIKIEEIQTFKNEFLERYLQHQQTIGDQEIRFISKFWIEKSDKVGWILDIASMEKEGFSDRYLALDGQLTLLDSDVPIECGFSTTAAKAINERTYDDDKGSLNFKETKFVVFQHGCAAGPSLTSLINLEEKRFIPFSDPDKLMSESIIDDNYIIGTFLDQPWNGILTIKLGGDPIEMGYAVFDLNSGKLLKIIEYATLSKKSSMADDKKKTTISMIMLQDK